jgi:hypothetical protein
MKIYFDHEKLDVYREGINLCAWVVLREGELAHAPQSEREHD